jgi:hypothetical protein
MTRLSRILMLFTIVWFIASAALLTRAAFIFDQQRKIPHQVLASVPFENEAGNIAFSLAQGHGFSNLFRRDTGPTAWLAPVYPFLLSLLFRAYGSFAFRAFLAAAILNALLSSAVTFPLYEIARRISGRNVAIATTWLWVFLPSGILMPFEWIWDTSLSVLLATTLVWMTLLIAESSNKKLWLTYAILWAFALLTNPSLGIALPFLLLWAAVRSSDSTKLSWRIPVASFALIVLCCLPWTVRNYSAFHRLIPLRSSFPFELWIGNNDIFDEHAVRGIQRITRYEETRKYAQLGENAYLDEKWTLARSFVQQKPALFLRLTGRKVIAAWAGTEHPFTEFLRTDSLLARTVIVCNLLLTLGTIAGVLLLARTKNPFAYPVTIFPALYPFIYYVTHTSLRYRHPIDPLLLFLTVFAAAACFSKLNRNPPTPSTTPEGQLQSVSLR